MNRSKVWQNLNLPNLSEVNGYDRSILTRAQNDINHAMDLLESACERLSKMDCYAKLQTEIKLIEFIGKITGK